MSSLAYVSPRLPDRTRSARCTLFNSVISCAHGQLIRLSLHSAGFLLVNALMCIYTIHMQTDVSRKHTVYIHTVNTLCTCCVACDSYIRKQQYTDHRKERETERETTVTSNISQPPYSTTNDSIRD